MTTRGTSQTGTSGQPPVPTGRTTRSGTRHSAPVPSPPGNGLSPGQKKEKKTAGEEARNILTKERCLLVDEKATPNTLYKIIERILK